MGRWLNAARSIESTPEKFQERPEAIPTEPTKPGSVSFVSSNLGQIEKFQTDASTFDERAGMASGSIPLCYLDAWASFQCTPSRIVAADIWQRAIDDAGLLLDQWGDRLADFSWPPESIFGADGLAWAIRAERVRAIGPDHALTESGRVFDRQAVLKQGQA